MIKHDSEIRLIPNCATCTHKVERHPSKRKSTKGTKLKYVCLVTCRAIGEHGCWTNHSEQQYTEDGTYIGFKEKWVQEVPRRAFDKNTGEWFALDYEPSE